MGKFYFSIPLTDEEHRVLVKDPSSHEARTLRKNCQQAWEPRNLTPDLTEAAKELRHRRPMTFHSSLESDDIEEVERLLAHRRTPIGPKVKPDEAPEDDHVVKPSHYERFKIEPITFIMENKLPFWLGNVIKYGCRAGYKVYDGLTQEQSEIRDLQKMRRYCEMRINQLEGRAPNA